MTISPTDGPIAVVGATGQQGSATLEALLRRGFTVRAFTRDTTSDASRVLASRGVDVVQADLDDADSVRRAFTGVAAAFAMTSFAGPGGTEGEVDHGTVIAEAARDAAVPFVVYSSVGGAERHTGVPHFESKRRVEQALEGVVPFNVVRPTFFMENLSHLIVRDGDKAVVRIPLPDGIPLQMVSVHTIGDVAAALLSNGDPTAAPAEIAGDELTGSQIAEAVARRLGIETGYVAAPLDVLDDDDQRAMFEWFTQLPAYRADFTRTRELSPEVEDLAQWLARQDDLV